MRFLANASPRRRRLFGLMLTVLLAFAILAIVVWSRAPSLDRVWDEDVRVLSSVEAFDDGTVRFGEVRNWRYTRDEVVSKTKGKIV